MRQFSTGGVSFDPALLHQSCCPCSANVYRRARTKGCVGWRIRVEVVDTDNLVVGAGGQVFAIGGEAYGVDGARMVAHGCQLPGLGVFGVARVGDGFCGPDAHVAIYG